MDVTADLTVIIATAGAALGFFILLLLLFVARAGAFRRRIDDRRMRRAKFQDKWGEILRAADDLARASSEQSHQNYRR